jgi:hypothetical protein
MDRRKPTRAVQESAEVVVPLVAHQRLREGPNDEEQGRAFDRLDAREPLHASRPANTRLPTHGDHRFNSPTGRCDVGVDRETNLAQVVRLTTAVNGGATNTVATALASIARLVSSLCRTAECGPACPVVWGGRPARAVLTRLRCNFE